MRFRTIQTTRRLLDRRKQASKAGKHKGKDRKKTCIDIQEWDHTKSTELIETEQKLYFFLSLFLYYK